MSTPEELLGPDLAAPSDPVERGGLVPPAPEAAPALGEVGAVGLALAVAAGAWLRPSVPWAVAWSLAIVASAVAWRWRRPVLLLAAGFVLAASLADRAWAGLAPPQPGRIDAVVTLVGDPDPGPFGTRADVRHDGRRYQLEASEGAGGSLSAALMGERVRVRGSIRAPPRPSPWLVPRHVVGVVAAEEVDRVDAGGAGWRAVNRVRRLIERGSRTLDDDVRALYRGFVLGDDQALGPAVVDDFRGAGLSHVLVVSGQNVAFVLLLQRPLLARLRWPGRWAVTVATIVGFSALTRFEPSILRASTMAAIAVSARALGRGATPVRALSLAVAGLVLVDPLLVHSVGFQLSVAATAAIAVLAARIARALPGPAMVREAMAVTLAAQAGVAPLVVARFEGIPVASLLANPLAVPVAGAVTSWGLPAGVVAGVLGGRAAAVLHLPTHLAVTYVAEVARVAASLPLGEIGGHLGLGVAAVGAVAVAARGRALRSVALVVACGLLLLPALSLRTPPAVVRLPHGGEVHRSSGVTEVVLAGASPAELLADLRRAGVRRIDVLRSPGPPHRDVLAALEHRWTIGRVVVDDGS